MFARNGVKTFHKHLPSLLAHNAWGMFLWSGCDRGNRSGARFTRLRSAVKRGADATEETEAEQGLRGSVPWERGADATEETEAEQGLRGSVPWWKEERNLRCPVA